MVKEKYKQLTSLIPSELLLAYQINGITIMKIHIRCKQAKVKP